MKEGRPSAGVKAVAGIDEAGLGPTLGPLVFGVTLFQGEAAAIDDLRRALAASVGRAFDPTGERLAIDDSKKLFAGRRSLAPLELPALATLHPGRAWPASLEAIVGERDLAWPEWYHPTVEEPLPRAIESALVERWRARWTEELAASGVRQVAGFVRPVLEQELNELFAGGQNKAQAVLTHVGALLRRVAAEVAGCDLDIVVDRLGGRRYYGDFLCGVFPLRPLRVLTETEICSRYALADRGRTLTITFEVEGDGHHLPVALASLCAKYTRELFLRRFNAYFGARKPGLAPTAGYPQDAERWLADAADVLTANDRDRLIRRR